MSKLNKILYVEDDPDIQSVAIIALEAVSGFTVRTCSSGSEALEQAENFSPDLLLLDVMMPGMDGPETLRHLREIATTAHTPAIFMTAKVQHDEVTQLKSLGAIDIIAKPFDPMTLGDQLRSIWSAQTA